MADGTLGVESTASINNKVKSSPQKTIQLHSENTRLPPKQSWWSARPTPLSRSSSCVLQSKHAHAWRNKCHDELNSLRQFDGTTNSNHMGSQDKAKRDRETHILCHKNAALRRPNMFEESVFETARKQQQYFCAVEELEDSPMIQRSLARRVGEKAFRSLRDVVRDHPNVVLGVLTSFLGYQRLAHTHLILSLGCTEDGYPSGDSDGGLGIGIPKRRTSNVKKREDVLAASRFATHNRRVHA